MAGQASQSEKLSGKPIVNGQWTPRHKRATHSLTISNKLIPITNYNAGEILATHMSRNFGGLQILTNR